MITSKTHILPGVMERGSKLKKGKATAEDAPLVVTQAVKKTTALGGPTRHLEESLRAQGYRYVGGADEAGRGPLAGPVVAAVCVLPDVVHGLDGLNDSKQVGEEDRERLYQCLTSNEEIKWAVHIVDHTEIDRINILQAAMLAMSVSAAQLEPQGYLDYLLVDGNRLPKDLTVPAQAVVKGDCKCLCIAAASIIAKVTRDQIMRQYDVQYPQYGFGKHKGYAVPAHYTAIHAHGPCDIHRRSFQPIRGITGWTREANNTEGDTKERKGKVPAKGGRASHAEEGNVLQTDNEDAEGGEELQAEPGKRRKATKSLRSKSKAAVVMYEDDREAEVGEEVATEGREKRAASNGDKGRKTTFTSHSNSRAAVVVYEDDGRAEVGEEVAAEGREKGAATSSGKGRKTTSRSRSMGKATVVEEKDEEDEVEDEVGEEKVTASNRAKKRRTTPRSHSKDNKAADVENGNPEGCVGKGIVTTKGKKMESRSKRTRMQEVAEEQGGAKEKPEVKRRGVLLPKQRKA